MTTDPDSNTVSNRSGGADLDAHGDIHIGGDVVGRDQLTSVTGDVIEGGGTKSVITVNHNNQGAVLVALVALAAVAMVIAVFTSKIPGPVASTPAQAAPAIVTPTLEACISTPVVIPTSVPDTGPLAVAQPLPRVCDEVRQLASYLAGNTVQIIQKSALDRVDETDLKKFFRGQALEQMAQLKTLTELAIGKTRSQNMIFQVDPLAAKITHIAVIDSQSIKVEVCVIIRGMEQGASRLATPYFQFALMEMQYQKIGPDWYVTSFPHMTAPPTC